MKNAQEGSRKQKGFYLSSVLLFIAYVAALWADADASTAFTMYASCQAGVGGLFFAANFGEHHSKAKEAAAKVGKEAPGA